jgi:hypothetical protein
MALSLTPKLTDFAYCHNCRGSSGARIHGHDRLQTPDSLDSFPKITNAFPASSLPLASVKEIFTRLIEADLSIVVAAHVFTGASAAIKVIFAADKEILAPAALAVQQDALADMPVAFTQRH